MNLHYSSETTQNPITKVDKEYIEKYRPSNVKHTTNFDELQLFLIFNPVTPTQDQGRQPVKLPKQHTDSLSHDLESGLVVGPLDFFNIVIVLVNMGLCKSTWGLYCLYFLYFF